jgi:TPP-dependent pyruvate/acetoin dehydrogenase alpha subunit
MTATALELVGQVRSGCCPLGVIVNVERLCAHSKGDEERQITEAIRARDPWLRISQELGDEPIKVQEEARRFIEELIASQ